MAVALGIIDQFVELSVAKERGSRGRPPIGKQFGVRLPSGLLADLEYIGETLGNDVSSVIRTILTENVSRYLMQAHEVRERREESAKVKGKSKPKGKE